MEEIGGGLEDVLVDAPKLYAELVEEPQTKTCIDAGTLVAGKKAAVLWMPEDQIGVFSEGSANVLYVNDEKVESVPNASFSGTAGVSGEIKYAYYPYDEANDGKEVTALTGVVPAKQTMGEQIPADYKYGELKGVDENGGYKFKFHNIFSLVRFKIDATETEFEGKTLESVTVTVTRGDKAVPVTGDFTFSAVDGAYVLGTTSNSLMTVWNKPMEGTPSAFASVLPEIRVGDKMTFVLRTEDKKISFTVTSKVDFRPETYYTFPLKLSSFASNTNAYGYNVVTRPTLNELKFEVSKNSGKLLDNKTTWNSSKHSVSFTSVSEHKATVSGSDVTLMIPYLFDYNLAPTFTVASDCTVTVDGQTIESGKTAVDFSQPVTLTVNSSDDWRDYTVTLSNTGLPVVVLKQSKSGDFDEVYNGGINIGSWNIGGTLVNKFVDFMIRGKETDWVEDDQMTVYNPDGTVNMPTTNCGARLRGNTSQEYPKKPFAIKLTSKQGILGMPSHKRWVLLANWLDHSMIRNTVAFDIAHAVEAAWKTGAIEPGIPWNVHGKNVELVIVESDGTGHHVGNYYLCEQIKIDKNRLNIQDPYEDVDNPTFETCGYLLEVDNVEEEIPYEFSTSKGIPFKFKDDVLSDDILNSVKNKVQGIENNIYNGAYSTAYNSLDINSVIDQMLIFELAMNREYGDPRSVYMFMDGNGKLSGGPVWDFDRGTFQNQEKAKTLGNSDRLKPDGEWMYWRSSGDEGKSYAYIWYKQLAKDPIFQAKVQARWAVIYPYLQGVSDKIREYGRTMRLSYESDSAMWPTKKADVQAHKSKFSDWSGDEEIDSWDELIENFVTVYEERLTGMNTLITTEKFTK